MYSAQWRKVGRLCTRACVWGGTWYTTKSGLFLDFAVGRIQACVMSLPHTVARSLFQRLVSFVKQKKKTTKIENYRSRIGKVHGSEITFNTIMCLLAIILYGFVLHKAQFTMVLLKGFKSSWYVIFCLYVF